MQINANCDRRCDLIGAVGKYVRTEQAHLIPLFTYYPLSMLWSANINLHGCPRVQVRRLNQTYMLLFHLVQSVYIWGSFWKQLMTVRWVRQYSTALADALIVNWRGGDSVEVVISHLNLHSRLSLSLQLRSEYREKCFILFLRNWQIGQNILILPKAGEVGMCVWVCVLVWGGV